MIKWLTCLLLVALVQLVTALPQGSQAPFSITISAAKDIFKVGSDVRVRLVLKNTSGEEIPYARGPGVGVEPQGELFSDVEVRDAKGELAPQTRLYLFLHGKGDASAGAENPPGKSSAAAPAPRTPEPRPVISMSVVGYMMKPGESRDEDIDVSKLYDLSQPGEYTISASRRLLDVATDPRSKIVAKSNTLTITITK